MCCSEERVHKTHCESANFMAKTLLNDEQTIMKIMTSLQQNTYLLFLICRVWADF